MYARGTTRDIQAHLEEIYGVEVSPGLISQVTETVMEEVTAWQNRPIDPLYFSVYLDALLVKMRHAGGVETGRGLKDILNACVVGLKGFPEAIEAAFPNQGAVMHRAHGSQQSGLRELEGTQARGRGSAPDLPGRDRSKVAPNWPPR